jgi:hypothetical protein
MLFGPRRDGWGRRGAASREVAGWIPDGIGIFYWNNPSPRTGVDSASNKNEYQEYFPGGGVKVAGA